MNVNTLVSPAIECHVSGHHAPGTITFAWNPKDPAAIEATFDIAPDPGVTWAFARELLMMGIYSGKSAGEGDVTVASTADAVTMHMSSPDGSCVIVMDRAPVENFFQATFSRVRCDLNPERGDSDESAAVIEGLMIDVANMLAAS